MLEFSTVNVCVSMCVCVYLAVGVLHPRGVCAAGRVLVALVIVQVEGLFAGAEAGRHGGTFHHGEADLHVHLRRAAPRDEARPQPVTQRRVRQTDLKGADAVPFLVQTAHLLPLTERSESLMKEHSNTEFTNTLTLFMS